MRTVLVVDHSRPMRMILEDILKRRGYTVLTAASADEAFRISEESEGSYQLLLTYVYLEDMPGPELAARLKADHPRIRVLFNARRLDIEIAKILASHQDYFFILKPFEESALLEKVRLAFTGRGREIVG